MCYLNRIPYYFIYPVLHVCNVVLWNNHTHISSTGCLYSTPSQTSHTLLLPIITLIPLCVMLFLLSSFTKCSPTVEYPPLDNEIHAWHFCRKWSLLLVCMRRGYTMYSIVPYWVTKCWWYYCVSCKVVFWDQQLTINHNNCKQLNTQDKFWTNQPTWLQRVQLLHNSWTDRHSYSGYNYYTTVEPTDIATAGTATTQALNRPTSLQRVQLLHNRWTDRHSYSGYNYYTTVDPTDIATAGTATTQPLNRPT